MIQSVATQYDNNGNPIFVTSSQLNTDQTTKRTTYVAEWYDALDRVTYTADYGTNSGTAMTQRPAVVPSAKRVCALTSNQYDAGGFLYMTTDPTGLQTTYSNDFLGRPWKKVVNSSLEAWRTIRTKSPVLLRRTEPADRGDDRKREAARPGAGICRNLGATACLGHRLHLPGEHGQRQSD